MTDVTEVCLKCDRDVLEMRQRCVGDVAEVCLRRDRDVTEVC